MISAGPHANLHSAPDR